MYLLLQTNRAGRTVVRKIAPRLAEGGTSTRSLLESSSTSASAELMGSTNAIIVWRRGTKSSSTSKAMLHQSTWNRKAAEIRRRFKQKICVSATKKHSTTTCDFTNSSPAPSVLEKSGAIASTSESAGSRAGGGGGGEEIHLVDPPKLKALRTLFVASAIPMVGFGFMDNVVMIQAGQYIDSTIGVSLGLATMTAAAAGQVVSDVSGVIFGGSLERLFIRLGLIRTPNLTQAQRQLPICRNTAMAGAVCGVVVGCALGALTLLLVDLEARHRIERAQQLREIVTDMISEHEASDDSVKADSDTGLSSETCTVYIASSQDFHLDENGEDKWRTSMKLLKDTDSELVRDCATKREAVLSSGGNYLCVPIADGDDLLAVIEFRHNRSSASAAASSSSSSSDAGTFSKNDVRIAKVMARHIAIFMNRIVE